jgi:hypothetical protein
MKLPNKPSPLRFAPSSLREYTRCLQMDKCGSIAFVLTVWAAHPFDKRNVQRSEIRKWGIGEHHA